MTYAKKGGSIIVMDFLSEQITNDTIEMLYNKYYTNTSVLFLLENMFPRNVNFRFIVHNVDYVIHLENARKSNSININPERFRRATDRAFSYAKRVVNEKRRENEEEVDDDDDYYDNDNEEEEEEEEEEEIMRYK